MKRCTSISSAACFPDSPRVRVVAAERHVSPHQATPCNSGLVEKPPGPTEKRAELIRVNNKVEDKRDRGQHEDQVSHMVPPWATALILPVTIVEASAWGRSISLAIKSAG